MREFNRKKIMLLGLVVLAICVGVINNKLSEQRLLQTSAEYVKYEGQEMRNYDESLAIVTSDATVSTDGVADTAQSNSEKFANDDDVTLVTSDNIADVNEKTTYFEEARASLDMDRNEVLSMLTEFAEESQDVDAKNKAVSQKLQLIDYMSKEKVIENLLINKGFNDAYVVMTDNAVNVTINKQELSQSDIAKIVDVVTRETDRPVSQIIIQSRL